MGLKQLTKNAYSKRSGVLAKKIGMCRMKVDGKMHGVTLLHLDDCKVISHIEDKNRGYNAVLMGIGTKKNVNKAQLKDQGNIACLKEFRVNSCEGAPVVGDNVIADYFAIGQTVDVSGVSKGKGFQGGMKRHGFHGLRATHGVSLAHRSLGSTGNRTEPGRVHPGKKMPGHMGFVAKTVQSVDVIYVSTEHNVIGILGGVPGSKNSILLSN